MAVLVKGFKLRGLTEPFFIAPQIAPCGATELQSLGFSPDLAPIRTPGWFLRLNRGAIKKRYCQTTQLEPLDKGSH